MIRAGIVGAGLMGRWHADAIRHSGGRVDAVADTNLDAARRLAGRGAQAFAQVEALLDAVPLDVLHICTPTRSHLPIALLALERKIHLLIEKPLTENYADTEHLYRAAADAGLIVCPVHQFMFQDGVVHAASDQLGKLLHLESTFYSAGGCSDEVVADILPHPLALIDHFMPGALASMQWQTLHPSVGELRAWSTWKEVTASITISMSARPTVAALRLVGTRGTVTLNLFHGYAVSEPGDVSRWRKIISPFDTAGRTLTASTLNLLKRGIQRETAYPGLRRLCRALYAAIGGDAPPPISPDSALAVALARDQLQRTFIKD